MVDASGIPRPFNPAQLGQDLNDLRRETQQQQSARRLESASIGKGGLSIQDGGSATVQDGGAFLVRDAAGEIVARYGPLLETAVGKFGLEVKIGATWMQVGAEVATWDNLAGKPGQFPPADHTHDGSQISGTVPAAQSAGYAGNAGHATDADGSGRAWAETNGPADRATVSVGSDGKFFKWSSSRRFKENIRDADFTLDQVRRLRPVIFDRIGGGAKDEIGFIAEEVEEVFPQTVFRDGEGRPEGINYEMLTAPLAAAIAALAAQNQALATRVSALELSATPDARRLVEPACPTTRRNDDEEDLDASR